MNRFAEKFVEQISSEKDMEKRMLLLTDYVNLYFDSNYDEVNLFLRKELKLFQEMKDINGEALIRFMLSYSFFERGQQQEGEKEFEKVMQLYPNVKDPLVRSQILNFLAFTNSHQGNFEKAIAYSYECIAEGEKSGKEVAALWGYYSLAVFHYDFKDFSNAEKFFTHALNGFVKNEYPYGAARSETGLASLYIQTGELDKAEKLLLKALSYYKELDVSSGQSRALNDLGIIAKRKNQNQKAIEYYNQALQIRKETKHLQGVSTTLNEIAELLLAEKKYVEAEKYLIEAREVCERINNKSKLYRTHLLFSELYSNLKEPWKALEHYKLYDKLKSEVIGETANNKIKELQTRMATEKSEREAEIERLKNVELKKAYNLIEEKQKEILESIAYAKYIQQAILPSQESINKLVKHIFIFYLPKDIVAGDFYFIEKHNGVVYIAAADCTGHGVPGAMVSVVCSNALNRAVKEFGLTDTGKILDKTRDLVLETLAKNETNVKDGMDISLLAINQTVNNEQRITVSWSGANNPFWYIQNGELKEIKADKQSIGKTDNPKPFTTHRIQLNRGDNIYLFTDGYADQFGGEKGKKFKYAQLKENLLAVRDNSMAEQKHQLEMNFANWKKNVEQVDDVCFIGIKL